MHALFTPRQTNWVQLDRNFTRQWAVRRLLTSTSARGLGRLLSLDSPQSNLRSCSINSPTPESILDTTAFLWDPSKNNNNFSSPKDFNFRRCHHFPQLLLKGKKGQSKYVLMKFKNCSTGLVGIKRWASFRRNVTQHLYCMQCCHVYIAVCG